MAFELGGIGREEKEEEEAKIGKVDSRICSTCVCTIDASFSTTFETHNDSGSRFVFCSGGRYKGFKGIGGAAGRE